MSKKYSAFIFDLDNTLIFENDYLFAAYKQIAINVQEKYQIPKNTIEEYLINSFIQNGRNNIFNKMINQFDLPQAELQNFLETLRTVKINPKIRIKDFVSKDLKDLILQNKSLFILTNGNPIQQQNKYKNIEWDGLDLFIRIYYSNLYKPKPSGKSLDILINENNLDRRDCLMIGDQDTDKECARNADVDFLFEKEYFKYDL